MTVDDFFGQSGSVQEEEEVEEEEEEWEDAGPIEEEEEEADAFTALLLRLAAAFRLHPNSIALVSSAVCRDTEALKLAQQVLEDYGIDDW
ncbi:hypothetical protein JCM10296v2_001474 [Rhodotorula toruloides]